MGGKAFRKHGIDTVRLDTASMVALAQPVLIYLDAITARASTAAVPLPGPRLVPWYRAKTDHGDADIVVSDTVIKHYGDAFVAQEVRLATGFETRFTRPDWRDPVMALAVNTPDGWFQIDLISSDDILHDFAVRYMSWNDTGALMGRVARQMGLRFGQNGLCMPIGLDGPEGVHSTILVSSDASAAIDFLGFDNEAHLAGLDDLDAIYDFISSSRYFQPDIFQPGRMTNAARRRATQRSFYPGFLEAISQRPARHEWPVDRSPEDLERWKNKTLDHFGAWNVYNAAVDAHQQRLADRAGFNVDTVSRISGISGSRLQHLVNAIRHSFASLDEFKAWRVTADESAIGERIAMVLPAMMECQRMDADGATT